MSTFSYNPDYSAQLTRTPNVKQIKFGDGYMQRQAQGMNTTPEAWDLTFSNRTQTEADAIDDFLSAANGIDSFDWTPPNEADPIKVICSSWQKTFVAAGATTITATFSQVFEP
jgi:phage-related protein